MRLGTLFWKLFLGNTLLIVMVLGTCAWLMTRYLDRFQRDDLSTHLRSQAMLIRYALMDRFSLDHAGELQEEVRRLHAAADGSIRVTLILPDGKVLADSEADAAGMEPHDTRPEVRQALVEGWGTDVRFSQTVQKEMKYVGLRVGDRDNPVGVVRVSMAIRTIGQRSDAIRRIVWTTMLLGIAAAVVFAMGLARVWSQPIHSITAIAHSLSRGDLSARASVRGNDELGILARSLNEMRDHLADQLRTIDRQRRTLESLLTQLSEGVIVVGGDGRIVLVNPAAVQMLDMGAGGPVGTGDLRGTPFERCVVHPELRNLLGSRTAAGESSAGNASTGTDRSVREIHLQSRDRNSELTVLARASDIMLPDLGDELDRPEAGGGRGTGRMLVLTDITELARAIRVKTDFASNASHELRTPLSAIRAAVETLLDLDLAEDASRARHFLQVVDRHSLRMQEMVSDLLNLSRLESSVTPPEPEPLSIPGLLEDLTRRFQERLESKQLAWSTHCEQGPGTVIVNPYLLRISLDNLVDNAIKFTDTGGSIRVVCRWLDGQANGRKTFEITVADTGCGIAEHEQSRVFERFYQVEKARSGPNRGTGLGLSIVRHAVMAMNGTVELKSRIGEGTQVTIRVPQPEQTVSEADPSASSPA